MASGEAEAERTRTGRRLRTLVRRPGVPLLSLITLAGLVLAVTGCGRAMAAGTPKGLITALGAENEYANVIAQVGGQYVQVSSILNNPNADPHAFESSPSVARRVAHAGLIVQNGVGYDDFMNKIEAGSPSSHRKVVVAQKLLGLPDQTPNPHLWYDPRTMPTVAKAIATDLSALQPAHASYFTANANSFSASLNPWRSAIARFKAQDSGTPVATTEPVADYLLSAMGANNLTPFRFQAEIMNGTDPTPQDISLVDNLLTQHRIKVFCYNAQVVSSVTAHVRTTALQHGVPVVAVYETMPTSGSTYQSWMLAETQAIQRAVSTGNSTEHL